MKKPSPSSVPGDLRPTERTIPGATPENPVAAPALLQPAVVDIDWGRRIARIEQLPDRFSLQPQVVYMPFFALKRLLTVILSADADAEVRHASHTPQGPSPSPTDRNVQ